MKIGPVDLNFWPFLGFILFIASFIISGIYILNKIIKKQAKKGDNLICAAIYDDVDKINSILASGEPVNYQNCDGWTALMYASLLGNENAFYYLINKGADKNIRNSEGKTALDLVKESRCRNQNILDFLLR